jgi:NDP-sugar pyrophosphorylase family protein
MAGAGKRFAEAGYELPKPLIDVEGKPMIQRAVESLGIEGKYIFAIRKYEDESHCQQLKSLLKTLAKEVLIYEIDFLTEGTACTCLLAQDKINSDEPLLIANCDQIMDWDAGNFLDFCSKNNFEGVVLTYDSDDPKNSFIELNSQGLAARLVEKEVISNNALIGIHYWSKGRYFVDSAIEMIENNERYNNEFYVAPSYNYMIKSGLRVTNYPVKEDEHYLIGTPKDLDKYLSKICKKSM